MKHLETFFDLNPVFTIQEAKAYLNKKGSIGNQLAYQCKIGRIFPVRRGLYYVVPPGTTSDSCEIDPYLIASKMTKDAVLAYQTALGLQGYGHSARFVFYYFTKNRAKTPFSFRGYTFQAISIPSSLIKAEKANFGVKTIERQGGKIRVTTLERTFVDILDRPYLTGSWEEIWKSLEGIEYLDVDQVVAYSLILSNKLINAKVGYFLDTHREQFRVTEAYLEKLKQNTFKRTRYLERMPKGPQKIIEDWHLSIPQFLHEKTWEEPHGDF